MVEETPGLDRYRKIKSAVAEAKKLGLSDRAVRREAVIDAKGAFKRGVFRVGEASALSQDQAPLFASVSKKDIRQESSEVSDIAINKYLEVYEGLSRIPILVDAIHSQRPTIAEIENSMGSAGINLPSSEVERFLAGKHGVGTETAKIVKQVSERFDEDTVDIAKKAADLTGASLIISKRSRIKSDLNRAWYVRGETRMEGEGSEDVTIAKASEYSRSSRAALYWAIRGVLEKQGRLGPIEKLKSPFCRLAVHGMKDNPYFDFAIAGSKEPADKDFIDWFRHELEGSLRLLGAEAIVVVATREDEKSSAYSGLPSLKHFRKAPKPEFYQHPDFGEGFNTIQLEIANRYRLSPEKRQLVAYALAEVLKKVPGYFEKR